MSEEQRKIDLGIWGKKKVPSMVRNQNGGVKKETHEGIEGGAVGEAAMAAVKKQRDENRRGKQSMSGSLRMEANQSWPRTKMAQNMVP